jgi:hypothetical protein
MQISSTTVGILLAASLGAGAAGAWVASRVEQTGTVEAPQATVPGPAVEESEGLVAPAPDVTDPEPAPAPVRRTPPPAPRVPDRAPVAHQAPAPRPETPADARAAAPPVTAPPVETPAPPPVETPQVAEAPAPPPAPAFDDLELPAQSVIGLQFETTVSSETARVEDEVIARVSRDVRVGERVAIPAGSKAHGEVTLVERGARVRERARLGVRFTSIVLADGTRLPIDTQAIYREGDSVRNENAAKIGGGAIGGAIIGGILGGAKGAAIGGSIGAGAGTAAVAAGGRNAATLPSGSPVTVRIERPVVVSVER